MPGKPEFSFEWNGAKWQFASNENLLKFKNSPEAYAPQYGGYCAYGASRGYLAQTDPQAFTILDNKLYLNGELVEDDFAAMEAQMSDFLLAPDWEEMRRAMTSAKAVLETGGVVGTGRDLINEITGTVFERYWRTSVIAFRGAYLIRNMADIQFRMYMAGHPSLLTNPLGITALATSHLAAPSGSLGRALNKMGDKDAKSLSKM